jgi:hypothetical protein
MHSVLITHRFIIAFAFAMLDMLNKEMNAAVDEFVHLLLCIISIAFFYTSFSSFCPSISICSTPTSMLKAIAVLGNPWPLRFFAWSDMQVSSHHHHPVSVSTDLHSNVCVYDNHNEHDHSCIDTDVDVCVFVPNVSAASISCSSSSCSSSSSSSSSYSSFASCSSFSTRTNRSSRPLIFF